MKMRLSYVANSSSSSFVILGTELTDELKKKFESFFEKDSEYDGDFYNSVEQIGLGLSWETNPTFIGYKFSISDCDSIKRRNINEVLENPALEILITFSGVDFDDLEFISGVEMS